MLVVSFSEDALTRFEGPENKKTMQMAIALQMLIGDTLIDQPIDTVKTI